jgi:thiamine-monophosphate kinase
VPLSEFEVIRRYFTHPAPGARLGVGDDAAIVAARRGMELVVTTDMLIAGRHFVRGTDPRKLGHKALAVNLSDMAAMGAAPRWATLALALPQADARWLAAFSAGFMATARRNRVALVGGDTTRGPLAICVQVIGEVPRGRALTRDGARAGHDIWVSGTLGDAALAVAAARGRLRLAPSDRARVQSRLDTPRSRVELGQQLRGVAASAIDISDGLLADLGHICERSGVAAVIEFERVPRSAVLRKHLDRPAARAALLAGGDDYELLFTARRSRRATIARLARRVKVRLTRIGRTVKAGGARVTVLGRDGRPLRVEETGFDHFA